MSQSCRANEHPHPATNVACTIALRRTSPARCKANSRGGRVPRRRTPPLYPRYHAPKISKRTISRKQIHRNLDLDHTQLRQPYLRRATPCLARNTLVERDDHSWIRPPCLSRGMATLAYGTPCECSVTYWYLLVPGGNRHAFPVGAERDAARARLRLR